MAADVRRRPDVVVGRRQIGGGVDVRRPSRCSDPARITTDCRAVYPRLERQRTQRIPGGSEGWVGLYGPATGSDQVRQWWLATTTDRFTTKVADSRDGGRLTQSTYTMATRAASHP